MSHLIPIGIVGALALGITAYYYPKPMKELAFGWANTLADGYLDLKYQLQPPDSVPETQELSPYQIDGFLVIDPAWGHNLSIDKTIDLRTERPQINKAYFLDLGIGDSSVLDLEYVCTPETLIYIRYSYGANRYILPLRWSSNFEVQFPLYEIDDLETCLKMEFDQATIIEPTKADPDHMTMIDEGEALSRVIDEGLLSPLAGPKGDFYAGLGLMVAPRDLVDLHSGKPLISDQQSLQITTMLGDIYHFQSHEPIIIKGL